MKERIKQKGNRVLAFVLALTMVLGIIPIASTSSAGNVSEPMLNENVVFNDTFDNGTNWDTSTGKWRLGSSSHAKWVGVRNGTAPMGYDTSTRNLYNVSLSDVHVSADVCVTKAECYGSTLQYHFLVARADTSAINGVAFGFKTLKNATKSSLIIGYYTGNDAITSWYETSAVYDLNTVYNLDLYVVDSLVMAKCEGQTIYLDEVTGISAEGYCGMTDRRATSKPAGTVYGTDYTKAGYFDNFSVSTVEEVIADGFKINGPVVATADGNGVADITLVSDGQDGATIDDAPVKIEGLINKPVNLYEGEYTVKATVGDTEKTAIAERVFIVEDLSKTVTKMSDSHWTGATTTEKPKFTVDANGVATLTPSGTAAAGLSVLNVGTSNGAYGNFYAEYTLTVSQLAAEARGFFDTFLCTDGYGTTSGSAWQANMFFDNRASQAPNKTFWARLKGTTTTNYSDTTADADIGLDKPFTIGMLVYEQTITLFINGTQVATYTGTANYTGWFGIAQSSAVGKATVENFVYIPLEKKAVSVEFDAPEAVVQGDSIEVKATPTYNWPYGVGAEEQATVSGLDTSTDGVKNYKVSFGGIEKELQITVTKKPDGFKVNGPVVMTKDGQGVADITILAGETEIETKEDVAVTVQGFDNPEAGIYEGEYEVTTDISGTNRTAKVTRVFVVDDMSKAVTNMTDGRWTGATASAQPNFTVDETGKATLKPAGTAATGLSVLNVGEDNGAYGNFYAEYTITMKDLANEARSFIDNFLSMNGYGDVATNAWDFNVLYDNRASQAPNKTFWARLQNSAILSKAIEYSTGAADPDIEGGKPMRLGFLVCESAISIFVNGVQAANYTGDAVYSGWFGIAQSSTNGAVTVDNFVYIPLPEKTTTDVEFSYPQHVLQDATVEVSAIPIYNWPYGKGEAIEENIVITGLDTSTVGEKTFKASYNGIEKELKVTVMEKPNGFKVNGPVVMTKDGKGLADITVLLGNTEYEIKEDVVVTVSDLENVEPGRYVGEYEIQTDIYGTNRIATATQVFVVDDMDAVVTNMSDNRWTGATASAQPNFTVDETGKATLKPSGSAKSGISVLNVGKDNGAYGNFYAEYSITMKDLGEDARSFVDNILSMNGYGDATVNAWDFNLLYDNRASQAPNKTFWARLQNSAVLTKAIEYSTDVADPDIEGGKPMRLGFLVCDSTITIFVNGDEVANYTGDTAYKGWFGIAQSSTNGTVIIDNFVYIPLAEKRIEDIEFSYPKNVLPGATIEVWAIPVYNWPYGMGKAVQNGVTVTGLDTSSFGEKTFKASYKGVEKTLTLTVGTIMFKEEFNGSLEELIDNGWGNVNKTTVTLDGNQLSLNGRQEGLYATNVIGSDAWTDYTVKADVVMTDKGTLANTNVATLVARSTGLQDGYEWSICFNKDGTSYVRLYDRTAQKQVVKVDYPVDLNEVYNLKLTVVGDTIKGYVNNEKLIETVVTTSSKGTIGVRRNGYAVRYDNVIVSLPEEDAPEEDVTKKQVWFTDTFEAETAMSERGWNIDGTIQNGQLILGGKQTTAFLTGISGSKNWTDYTAKADVMVTSSDEISSVGTNVTALVFRSTSSSTGYEFGVTISSSDNKGGFRLYNRTTGKQLAFSNEIVAERGKTYNLTAVVEGNHILCFVDGTLMFDVTDSTNPKGYIGLRTGGYKGAYDNVIVRKVTDADRKGLIKNDITSPTTGDTMIFGYVPMLMLCVSMAVIVLYVLRRWGKLR